MSLLTCTVASSAWSSAAFEDALASLHTRVNARAREAKAGSRADVAGAPLLHATSRHSANLEDTFGGCIASHVQANHEPVSYKVLVDRHVAVGNSLPVPRRRASLCRLDLKLLPSRSQASFV
jgi:hypothetical protein